ncbi:DUF7301 family protein, partial [Escherichia coli]|uniref:DUF7301 family protein n=1 Tax=Escherichia coli TaxID=562 RepID=UPI001FCF1301
EKRVFLVILFTSFSGSLVSRIPGAVHNRYWKSSSLPVCERFNHRPKPKRSRRDKVLKKLMQINMAGFVRFVSETINGD